MNRTPSVPRSVLHYDVGNDPYHKLIPLVLCVAHEGIIVSIPHKIVLKSILTSFWVSAAPERWSKYTTKYNKII